MNDPLRVRFSGPLAAHADGLRAELESRGYTPGSAALQLQVAAQLSRWMQASGFGLGDLADAACVGEFFAQRRVRGLKCHISPKAVTWLMDYLSARGLLPAPVPVPASAADRLLDRYRGYLLQERGLAPGTTGALPEPGTSVPRVMPDVRGLAGQRRDRRRGARVPDRGVRGQERRVGGLRHGRGPIPAAVPAPGRAAARAACAGRADAGAVAAALAARPNRPERAGGLAGQLRPGHARRAPGPRGARRAVAAGPAGRPGRRAPAVPRRLGPRHAAGARQRIAD